MGEGYDWIATAPFGLEGVVAEELRGLGMRDVRADGGEARFAGTAADALRANLWLRAADRVLLMVGRFEALSFDALFEGVAALPWERYIPWDAQFPVRGSCGRSRLMSVSDCQAITKKAIAERLKRAHGRELLPERGETYEVQVALNRDRATLTLNASGAGLSRRGYRTFNGEAPLRETLAASLLLLSPWRPGRALHDPLCGTGTILAEAALMAANRAPGLMRPFAMEAWRMLPKANAAALRDEARAAVDLERVRGISGADLDAGALALCHRHLAQAGLSGRVPVRQADIRDAGFPEGADIIVTNPPYGERLSDRKGCEAIARALRRAQADSRATVCVITAFTGFERAFGRRADKRRRLYNGRLECEFMTFYGQRAST